MKKSILTAIAAIAITSLSFAGTPKGDAKITNNESPTETKVKAKVKGLHTYWITQANSDGTYSLSDQDTNACEEFATSPCKITTDNDYSLSGMKAPQADVDNENGVDILEYRNL